MLKNVQWAGLMEEKYSEEFRARKARNNAFSTLVNWRRKNIIKYKGETMSHLTKLIGCKDIHWLKFNESPGSTRTLELLAGPNGLTIYRMLLIKHSLTESQIPDASQ